MGDEITAIIVARGNSQRIEGKALQELHGHSLLSRKIKQLKEAQRVQRVIVGSDSHAILQHAQALGSEIVRRPDYFCDEHQASANEMIHNMCELVVTDIILWAHCTNPLLTSQTYDKALEAFLSHEQHGFDSLVSVAKIQEHIWSSEKIPLNYDPYLPRHTPAKELAPLYVQDGGIFIQRHMNMRKNSYFFGKHPYLFEIPDDEYLDINNMRDLEIARALLNPEARMNSMGHIHSKTSDD